MNKIPKGYKQTEVGVIPGDWDFDEIQKLADISTGAKNTQDRILDGDYPFFVRSQTVERINSYSFDGEAVLTAGDGVGTGKVFHYINGKFDFHQRVYKISKFSECLDGYFFYLYFSKNFYNRIMQMNYLRSTLERWPDLKTWQTEKIKGTNIFTRFESIPFISIEAQRDIHQELKERSSFIGKVLSNIEYNPTEIAAIESLIKEVNDETVNKSDVLQGLKTHLEQLNHSFQGTGIAEITPFPKKIRDFSKHFSIHFGDNSSGVFSMEYHGMGSRSWASMLTVKAFTDLMAAKHKKEAKPFFPILAAEEPEAHLHLCSSCKQPIYANVLREYKSSNGYDQALIDILDSSKPKYAPAIAEKLCELEIKDFPPKVIDLFEKIRAGAEL